MNRVAIFLPKALYFAVLELSELNGISVAQTVRSLIFYGLKYLAEEGDFDETA